jgi:hypothetical protein
MRATPIVESGFDPRLVPQLVEAADAHLGHPAHVIRVGITEVTGQGYGSYTAVAVNKSLVALAEIRVRGGEWLPVTVQAFSRRSVIQLVTRDDDAWLIIDAPEISARQSGLVIEGPALSVPRSLLAHEILLP